MAYVLRDYQREACDAAWRSLCALPGNPLIVLPTGAGKSLVIAEVCRRAVEEFGGRVLVVQHRKELIRQNFDKINALVPCEITIGLYSAGLKERQSDQQIVLSGIQSAYKKAELFGERHLLLIDESHLVPNDGEGMYRKFISDLRAINPKLRAIGLTATPYRTGEGKLIGKNKLFQRICYEASIPRLIEDGHLSRVVNVAADETQDTSKLHTRQGEFIPGEVTQLFDDARKIDAACREIIAKTENRKSVLVFCAGVNHAERVCQKINALGPECGVVSGETPAIERAAILERFREGRLKYLCNVDVLTTGFDAPCIDCIAILRATQSPGLFAQICGRGFRLYPGKIDCLLLDFGENLKRHGPLDAIDYGKPSAGGGRSGGAVEKVCPNCESDCPAGVRECEDCGFAFPPPELKHGTQADEDSSALSGASEPQVFVVQEVHFARHIKKKEPSAPHTLRVDYVCEPPGGGNMPIVISEWVCLMHSGFAFVKAMRWWRQRSRATFSASLPGTPETDEDGYDVLQFDHIDNAVDLFKRGAVAVPSRITAAKDGRFWRITDYDLDPIPETWSDDPVEFDFASESEDEIPF